MGHLVLAVVRTGKMLKRSSEPILEHMVTFVIPGAAVQFCVDGTAHNFTALTPHPDTGITSDVVFYNVTSPEGYSAGDFIPFSEYNVPKECEGFKYCLFDSPAKVANWLREGCAL